MPWARTASLSAVLRPGLCPRVIFAALLLTLAALVSGCGEKEEPDTTGPVVARTTSGTAQTTSTAPTTTSTSTSGGDPGQTDQALATKAATEFLTLPGPNVCDSGVTEALLRSAYGDRAGCAAARKISSLAENVRLSNVRLGQGTATLTADAKGGTYGAGQKVQMSLVRDGTGTWRVDKIASNVPVGP